MDRVNNIDTVKKQYANSDNLNIRINIHTKYSINKQGFGNWINEQYNLFNGCHILELGCGNGVMWTDMINHIGMESTLILSDLSEGMVEEVKNKYSTYDKLSVQQINIEDIPFQDNSFDVVIANMMLYHVADLDKALTEVSRVLKKNGTFYTATYGEKGIQKYILTALKEYGLNENNKNAFTLQNGDSILGKYFSNVVKKEYIDALDITDTNDLLNYIYSMPSIINVKEEDRQSLFEFFENRKDDNGVIRVPKEHGLFISSK